MKASMQDDIMAALRKSADARLRSIESRARMVAHLVLDDGVTRYLWVREHPPELDLSADTATYTLKTDVEWTTSPEITDRSGKWERYELDVETVRVFLGPFEAS